MRSLGSHGLLTGSAKFSWRYEELHHD